MDAPESMLEEFLDVNDFEYEALHINQGSQSIRLLELLPGEASQRIRCFLEEAVLSQRPQYEALSYCWGDVAEKVPILCNDKRIDVTVNLGAALQHLRKADSPRRLWIDFICINQTDLVEKEAQVSMMGLIYRQAQHTVVWLGPSSIDSDLAIATCQRYALSIVKPDDEDEEPFLRRPGVISGGQVEPDAVAIMRLLKRPWFKRVWVIQEIALATDVKMMCGHGEISFEALSIGSALFATTPQHVYHSVAYRNLGISSLSTMRSWQSSSPGSLDISTLLLRSRVFHSTDPRDKLFGLLGMIPRENFLELAPNYRLTTQEVFTKAVLAILEDSRSLMLLEMPHGRRSTFPELPSWVPDFSDTCDFPCTFTEMENHQYRTSATEMRALLATVLRSEDGQPYEEQIEEALVRLRKQYPSLHEPNGIDNAPAHLYSASKGTVSSSSLCYTEGAISIFGHTFDEISEVAGVFCLPSIDAQWVEKFQRGILREAVKTIREVLCLFSEMSSTLVEWDWLAFGHSLPAYPTGESHTTAYWQTLTAGCYPQDLLAAEAHFRQWRRIFSGTRFLKRFNLLGSIFTNGLNLLSVAILSTIQGPAGQNFAQWSGMANSRRLARTAKGYLALVPAETEVGDSVTILKGGRVPFILRSRDGPWELIGGSYVHGIMHGEAFSEEHCVKILLV